MTISAEEPERDKRWLALSHDRNPALALVAKYIAEVERQNALLDKINTRLGMLDPKMDNIAAIIASKDAEIARLAGLIEKVKDAGLWPTWIDAAPSPR